MNNNKIISREVTIIDLNFRYKDYCAVRVPSKKYSNVDNYYICPLRQVSYEDGYSTSYSCMINGQEANDNCKCGVPYNAVAYDGRKIVKELRIE